MTENPGNNVQHYGLANKIKALDGYNTELASVLAWFWGSDLRYDRLHGGFHSCLSDVFLCFFSVFQTVWKSNLIQKAYVLQPVCPGENRFKTLLKQAEFGLI